MGASPSVEFADGDRVPGLLELQPLRGSERLAAVDKSPSDGRTVDAYRYGRTGTATPFFDGSSFLRPALHERGG